MMKKNIWRTIGFVGMVGMAGVGHTGEDPSAMGTRNPLVDVSMPNAAAQTLTIPSVWGAWGNTVFIGAGITDPAPYSKRVIGKNPAGKLVIGPKTRSGKEDASASAGFGIGNPVENVGLQVSATINDVSEQDNTSYGIVLHRYIGNATSVAIGGEHLFRDKDESDVGESYYLALGHAFQGFASDDAKVSKLHGTLGVGNGRFAHKSELDEADKKGESGTAVFGALAYQLFTRTNLILEWNGVNLNAGVGITPFRHFPLALTLGAADLTGNSGDGARFIGAAGLAYQFN